MNAPRSVRRFALSLAPLAGLVLAAAPVGVGLLLASPASAQLTPVEPYSVVVTDDAVNLRCGAGTVWYPVAQLTRGDVLRVDGTEFGWLRVSYPPGAPALVKSNEATLDEPRGVVKLTKRTKLLAANLQGGVTESWRALLDNELAAGTELQSLGAVKDSGGAVTGFRVVAPDGSRGFVSERFVRKATDADLAAVKNAPTPAVTPAAKPTPKEPAKPTTLAAAPPQTAPAGVQPSGQPGAAQPVSQPVAQPSTPPTQPPPSQPAPGATPGTTPGTTPGAAPGAAPTGATPEQPAAQPVAPPPAPKPVDRRVAELDALNAKYEAIKKVPVENAEIEPLIAEYQRLHASLGDSPQNSTRRAVVNGTIDLLNARLDLKKARLAAAQAVADADKDWKAVAERKAALDAKPRYTVVGRLSASTVYDGDRLPLMFRILSVEGFPGRTLAYITPAPGVDVAGRVGLLVGVMGEGNVDGSLGVPVLRPTRIDPLTPTGAPLAPAPAAAPAPSSTGSPPPATTTTTTAVPAPQ